MTIKLSEELVQELERNGDQPLPVENPRTKKLYVVVSLDKYVVSPQTRSCGDSPETDEWDEGKNNRRFALIEKQIAGTLLPVEAVELEQLQRQLDIFLRRVAPLPLESLRHLHDQMLRKARDSGAIATS